MSVRLKGVSKTFGRVEALRDVDLRLEKGEVVGILGPNGSGKSTLLKLIAGLLLPDSGEVEVLGSPPRRLRGRIAYLPEVPFLPSWMGPREVERFMKGLFPRFRRERFWELVTALGIPPRPVRSLSKGQIQRLELAAVLAQEVEIYLLDEPLGGIDIVSRERILSSLIQAWRREATFILSTHAIAETETLWDRVVFLKEGRVILDRMAEDLRAEGKSVRGAYLEVFRREDALLV